jgi:hypothetical protein
MKAREALIVWNDQDVKVTKLGSRDPARGPDFSRNRVRFSFALSGLLLERAPIGSWPRAPRGVRLEVRRDGAVEVTCINGSELHARDLVIATAGAFVRSIDHAPPTSIAAVLRCGDRRILRYAITLGARVSIAQSNERPVMFGNLLAIAG